jgi:hypothetical protein
MARLRNEELEEELVRYKLLYSAIPFPSAMVLKYATVMPKSCMRMRIPCRLTACHLGEVEGEVIIHKKHWHQGTYGIQVSEILRVIHVIQTRCFDPA